MKRKERIFTADFETTVYTGQEYTEVWVAGLCELGKDDVQLFGNISDFLSYIYQLKTNCLIYFHNLKFDGEFIINHLLTTGMKQALITDGDKTVGFMENKEMPSNTFKYLISDMGQWYNITIKKNNRFIEFRDSLKLLPFSLAKIGKDFKTKHQKLEINYDGFRYADCELTGQERDYIKNDVLVLNEALEICDNSGIRDKMTIGSNALSKFQHIITKREFDNYFPDLSSIKIDFQKYGAENADAYIRNAYRGGWCYVKKGCENRVIENGLTLDVNSLYPSVMHSVSGNPYPVGKPFFWKGDYIPAFCNDDDVYFYVRVKTMFHVKQNHLPMIQIKNSFRFMGNVYLETTDIEVNGKRYKKFYDEMGELKDTRVILTLSKTDYKLFLSHYDVDEFEILDGCYFQAITGIFDNYINHFAEIKKSSKGAQRAISKLFLNSLYGKLAANDRSSYKVCYLKEGGELGFYVVEAHDKKCGHIACGAAVTAYAREFTITAAQKNYGSFIYADTDSLHIQGTIENVTGVKIDPLEFCCWKCETNWDRGIFVRQKTYCEHVTHVDMAKLENPFYKITCAGLPDRCKEKVANKLESGQMVLEDFKRGFEVDGKLTPKHIRGGVVLKETTFIMR